MANEEHLAILKQGVNVWNKWREDHPEIIPDLTSLYLRGLDLTGVNLENAYLDGASLKAAKLINAKLTKSDLHEADLTEVDLSAANIISANLKGAYLTGANLTKARLIGSDLSWADIVKANLTGANLNRASLQEAKLTEANLKAAKFIESYLHGADLRGVYLADANLRKAILVNANLSKSVLVEVDLSDANLRGSDFRQAHIVSVIFDKAILAGAYINESIVESSYFCDIDLSEVKGLETVKHFSPSTIGIDTLYKSKGKIHPAFLRGAGVPEELIEYLPSLVTGKAIQYYSCFISYSTRDKDFTERLHADLQSKGVRCWFAPEDIKGGRKLHEQIPEAIRLYDKLLLVLSENSMSSEWVKTEIYHARQDEIRDKRRKLFPIGLVDFDSIRQWQAFDADSGKDMAREIREYYIPDFFNWRDHDAYKKAFDRLLRDLNLDAQG